MITLIDLILLTAVVLFVMVYSTDKKLFVANKHGVSPHDGHSSVTIHFVHGHFPKGNVMKTYKSLNNKTSGYAVMQIDNFVYTFEVKGGKWMHIMPQDHRHDFNSLFASQPFDLWSVETFNEMVTSVEVPVTEEQKKALLDIYNSYLKKTPYDYAFFGHGSASAIYEILAETEIVPPQNPTNRYMMYAFHPRLFRTRIVEWAEANHFHVEVKGGEANQYWEK